MHHVQLGSAEQPPSVLCRSNYTQSGRIAAELLSKCVPKNARVLAMAGNLEYDGHRTRLDGFCEHLKKKGFSSSQIEIEGDL